MENLGATSLTKHVEMVRQGDEDAGNRLANIFLPLAYKFARQATRDSPQNKIDSEDIANSAMKSFCLGVREGRVSYSGDRQLAALLKTIVARKVSKLWKRNLAAKRDIRLEADGASSGNEDRACILDLCPGRDGGSVFLADQSISVSLKEQEDAAEVATTLGPELRGLFAQLVMELDEQPRRALMIMLDEDLSDKQLAKKMGRAVSSAERYKTLIRSTLNRIANSDEEPR